MSSVSKQNKEETTGKEEDDTSEGLFGSKEKMRSLMTKAKNEYLSKHKDLVDEYLKKKPDANTLDILNHIRVSTASNSDDGGVSLNCLFILSIALIIVIILRIQYNFYVEELLISSLFFSLNPSIDINLLLNDLPLSIDECIAPNYWIKDNDNKEWIKDNMEYCNFVRMSINRKLLYLYEYSSHSFKQNSNDLNTLMQWILDQRFNINTDSKQDTKLMAWSDIQNKEDFKRFILLNIENVLNKWNIYIDKIEKMYAKKSDIELSDIMYRLVHEISHYLFINSLNDLNDNEIMDSTQLNIDIIGAIGGYLSYEYFRDGFVCILSKKENDKHEFVIDFVMINELIDNSKIEYYLNVISKGEMICINTFESIGRFKNEIKIYLKIIGESLNHWTELQNIILSKTFVIDKYNEIKNDLSSEFKGNKANIKPFWNNYDWLKGNGISMESLIVHNKFIYSKNYIEKDIEKDIKYSMKKESNFYSNNYVFHKYFFSQFQTEDLSTEHWKEITEFMNVINKQFGSVSILIQEMVKYISNNYVYYNPGFVWILCDNNKLYFSYTLRYNALSSNDGIVMLFDLWSHSYYNDFIKGNVAKGSQSKFKRKESIGESIDVKHIGSSAQKTFNYPRSKMEVFGYYINALIHNLDWLKVAKRWQMQCKNKESQQKRNDKYPDPPQHQEL